MLPNLTPGYKYYLEYAPAGGEIKMSILYAFTPCGGRFRAPAGRKGSVCVEYWWLFYLNLVLHQGYFYEH
jgi:hypothetical protein